jgi:DNA gyrase subunit B
VNREPIIAHVISMDNEKEIPVEVALIYNTSYTENIFSYVNNINTKEHLQGFRTGLTRSLRNMQMRLECWIN